jgi:hypothetical protein
MEERRKIECEVSRVAVVLGVTFVGSGDVLRGRAAFSGVGFNFLKGRKEG